MPLHGVRQFCEIEQGFSLVGYVTTFNSMVDGGELVKMSGPPIDAKQDRWKRLA